MVLYLKANFDSDNCFAVNNLTDETHIQSFAMTSSFSNMYLATFLAFNLDNLDESIAKVEKLLLLVKLLR